MVRNLRMINSCRLLAVLLAAWAVTAATAEPRLPAGPMVRRATPAEDAKVVELQREISQLDVEIARLQAQRDAQTGREMSSGGNLKLQQAMERRSKAQQMLSNLTKKSNETSRSTIQNLK